MLPPPRALFALALLAPVLGYGGSLWAMPRIGDRVATELARAFPARIKASVQTAPMGGDVLWDPTGPGLGSPRSGTLLDSELAGDDGLAPGVTVAPAGGVTHGLRAKGTTDAPAPTDLAAKLPKGIFVPAATVLRFARTSKVQGTSVSGAGYSGIAVRGAQALGVANGDVLTHVNGQPVGSVSDVTAIVLSALGAGQKRISGTLLRPSLPDSGPRTYPITVEVPAQAGADSH